MDSGSGISTLAEEKGRGCAGSAESDAIRVDKGV